MNKSEVAHPEEDRAALGAGLGLEVVGVITNLN